MNLADRCGDEGGGPAELLVRCQAQTFGSFTRGVCNGADTKSGTRAVMVLPGVEPHVDHETQNAQ